MRRDVPGQEEPRKWFRSHLLGREVELQELYDLNLSELDLLMAETAEIRSDLENRVRNHGRWCTAVTCSNWHASLMQGACVIETLSQPKPVMYVQCQSADQYHFFHMRDMHSARKTAR